MKFTSRIFLIAILLFAGRSKAQNPEAVNPAQARYAQAQLQEDLRLLRRALEEAHPALYRYTSKTALDSLFLSIGATLKEGMNEPDFYRLLLPVFASIKCGHTRLAPSPASIRYIGEKAKIAPFDIRIIGGRFYILNNYSSDSTLVKASELVSVNSIPVAAVLEKLMQNAFTDGLGTSMKYRMIEREFFFFYFLAYGEADTFRLETRQPSTGQKNSHVLPAGFLRDRKRQPKPPLEFRIADTKAVLTLRTFDRSRLERSSVNFTNYIDSVVLILKHKNISRLIVDIRGNDGGDPALAAYLCRQFSKTSFNLLNYAEFKTDRRLDYFGDSQDTSDFYHFRKTKDSYYWYDTQNDWYGTYTPVKEGYKGQVFLLTDGGSFSSGGFLASLFSYYKLGKIIGEESGGGNCCNDCHGTLLLPNTQLVAQIARCHVTMNLPGTRCGERGISPDLPAALTVEDLIHGKDSVLEFALNVKE